MFWLLAIILTIAISFFLAYRSMKDFQEKPSERLSYGLFLIRNPAAMDNQFFTIIYQFGLKKGIIFSLERLLKGANSALVIYGPKAVLNNFPSLNLIELEDYLAPLDPAGFTAWEAVPVSNSATSQQLHLPDEKPQLSDTEQCFFQIVIQPAKHSHNTFQATIRLALFSQQTSRDNLQKQIDQYLNTKLHLQKAVKPQTSSQILKSYKTRSLIPKEIKPQLLEPQVILKLLSF